MEIHDSWKPIVNYLYEEPLLELKTNILSNISSLPSYNNIFNVFKMPVSDVKVVILGQDPYPTPNTATGYSFAVEKSHTIPLSLGMIREEIKNEDMESYSGPEDFQGEDWRTLEHWTNQGVFLLNTALTVEVGRAGSHLKYWEEFTKMVLRFLSATNPCIWLLWGKKVQLFESSIHNPFIVKGYDKETIKDIPVFLDKNYILEAPHPIASSFEGSPTFIGCNHFLFTNEILELKRKKKIKW